MVCEKWTRKLIWSIDVWEFSIFIKYYDRKLSRCYERTHLVYYKFTNKYNRKKESQRHNDMPSYFPIDQWKRYSWWHIYEIAQESRTLICLLWQNKDLPIMRHLPFIRQIPNNRSCGRPITLVLLQYPQSADCWLRYLTSLFSGWSAACSLTSQTNGPRLYIYYIYVYEYTHSYLRIGLRVRMCVCASSPSIHITTDSRIKLYANMFEI